MKNKFYADRFKNEETIYVSEEDERRAKKYDISIWALLRLCHQEN